MWSSGWRCTGRSEHRHTRLNQPKTVRNTGAEVPDKIWACASTAHPVLLPWGEKEPSAQRNGPAVSTLISPRLIAGIRISISSRYCSLVS
jgi:hypothetical protein